MSSINHPTNQKTEFLLAIETSSSLGSVAIHDSTQIVSETTWTRTSHSESLTSAIETVTAQTGITLRDLDSIAVDVGPGSFTGIRVGVNAVRSLAYALKLPVFAFDATEVLAYSVQSTDLPLLVLINAQKRSFFAATYKAESSATPLGSWTRSSDLKLVHSDELPGLLSSPHLVVGDGVEEALAAQPGLSSRFVRDSKCSDFPSGVALAQLANQLKLHRKALVWNELQALYIRASGAEETKEEKHRAGSRIK